MKRVAIIAALVALTVGQAIASDVKGFETTWEAAKAKAVAEGKPIYLHFTTTWCSWCRKIEKDTYPSDAGSKALGSFVSASLDCTVPRGQKPSPAAMINIGLMRKFGGSGYPFLAMVTPDQAVLNTINGYVPPEKFVVQLAKAQKVLAALKAVEAELAKPGEKDYATRLKAMTVFAKVRLRAKAGQQAEKIRQLDPSDAKGDAALAAFALIQAASVAVPADKAAAKARKIKIEALAADIRKFDPDNAKGILVKLLHGRAREGLGQATAKGVDTEDCLARIKEVEATLGEIAKVAPEFKGTQMLWAAVGQVSIRAGNREGALLAFQKSLAVDPNSRVAAQLRKAIEQLSRAKK